MTNRPGRSPLVRRSSSSGRRLLSPAPLAALLVVVAACVTGAGKNGDDANDGEDDDAREELLLFACHPAADAPHAQIQVYEIAPDTPPPPGAPKAVLIELSQLEDGLTGTCRRRPDAKHPGKSRFTCVSADAAFQMLWPEDRHPGGVLPPKRAQVEVHERSWLFWTDTYTVGCETQI